MQGMSGLSPEHAALLRDLDASLRWCSRRARAAHFVAHAGVCLLEGLVHCGLLWGMVPTAAYFPVAGAEWRRGGGAPGANDLG
jgi:hypothetical protein